MNANTITYLTIFFSILDDILKVPEESIIQYTKTQRGQLMLIHNGFKYVRNRQSKKNIFWRCSRYVRFGCRATAVTSRKPAALTIRLSGQSHSHERETKKEEHLEPFASLDLLSDFTYSLTD